MKTTRRKSRKTCGRGQGCTKIQPPVEQEFYQPSNNKEQKIIEIIYGLKVFFNEYI